jgi:hypothetical protein
MPILRLLLPTFCCLALAAAEPSWVANRPAEPGTLFGVGVGTDGPTSRDEALADLAMQLNVSVTSERSSTVSSTAAATGDTTSNELRQTYDQRTAVRAAARFLPGVTVAKQETVDGQTWTLVRLERIAFVAAAKARAKEIDRQTADIPAESEVLDGARVRALRGLLAAAEERAALALALTGQGVNVPPPPLSVDQIRAQLGLLANGTTVWIAGADQAAGVRDAITAVLDELGLQAAANAEAATFVLAATENARARQLAGRPWTRVDLTGSVTARLRSPARTLGSIEVSSSATSTSSEADGRAEARTALITDLGAELRKRLLTVLVRGQP